MYISKSGMNRRKAQENIRTNKCESFDLKVIDLSLKLWHLECKPSREKHRSKWHV